MTFPVETTARSIGRDPALSGGRPWWLVCAAFVLLCAGSLRAESAVPSIQSLLTQLETGDFSERTRAEADLFRHGTPAIPQLSEAARDGSPELSARIVRVLRRIYLSDTGEVGEQAGEALEALSESENPGAAREALGTLQVDRESRAIEVIRSLGGKVRRDDESFDGRADIEVRIEQGWKGGEEGLKHFSRISPERRLMVTIIDGSGVSPEAAQKLQGDHPWMTIQVRGSATLGIGPDPFPGRGCVIGKVLPNNAAEKAGMEVGDRVLKADGRDIENFDNLVTYLRTRKAGDKVELQVERNGRTVDLTATLQGWKNIDDAIDAARPERTPSFLVPPPQFRR
jgi:hypothetical protein